MDLKKKHIEWDMSGEHIEIGGLYNVTGNVLILPITGSGPANITLSEYPLSSWGPAGARITQPSTAPPHGENIALDSNEAS